MWKLLLWVGLVLVLKHHDGAAHKLVCYFTNWAHSRPGPASILPHDLDPFLCTHLIFAFASMNNNQIVAKDLQDEKILYPEFNKLKERNRELKTLLSIGGWNFGTSRFTTMLSTFANREKFIASVISLLRTHDFDGLDLFFLYPGLRGSPMHDRWTFLFLIEELLFAFRKEALLTMRPRLLLSAAVSGVPHIVQTSYDVRFLGRLLDFINVLSYDLHGSWEKFTGHNSPLFSLPEDPKSSAYAMNYWRKLGAPSEKLIMGIPTYGRTFRLLKASKNGLQATAIGPASPGKYTKQAGFLAYFEICSFVWGAKKHWIDYQYVPYANKGKEWVGYDDAISFSYKAWFIRREHFGGAMVWTLDMDDVRGTFCGTGPFPLVYVMNDILVRAEFSSTSLPQFWLSSAVNSSSTDPERLAVTKAWTTDIKILPPGGEAGVTEIHGKCENMTITPRVTIVTPTKETVSLGKHTVALGEKTEITGATTMTSVGHQSMTPGEKALTPVGHQSELPGKKTLTPVGHQSVTTGQKTLISVGYHSVTPGEKTLTPVGHPSVTPVSHQSVSPGGMTMTPVHFQTETLRQNTMAPRRKAVAHEKVTVPSRKISVTPEGQTVPLRGEYLTSETGTHPQDG
ncbi:oviduct-specific glycoprotein precursor [Papio anubis]|uniref:Oviduct-specific glycoprotein n=1 Tax=Papio anubis TaxID=9555 RepID=OVGP1_PAPAN|nr:oviduct-specific glycoprotein precursor [Papio anubis]P36718.2 RecName: Full=Oviduct-specific glycoprotein; AltName: Full=Estrogen-dependent oviduct protein; AltName: Full=Oviductal glycoprotein; AltName: Full=Oviductin; Flags: Precursor [Papio anubis]AAB39765.1 estradiol-dependent oviduct-specific glycoprotein [Papio anubis]